MNSDELAKMVEMAKERAGWHVGEYRDLPSVLNEKEWIVAYDIQRKNASFIANAPAAIVALAEQLEQMKVGKDTLVHIAFDYWQELEALKAKLAALKAILAEGTTP